MDRRAFLRTVGIAAAAGTIGADLAGCGQSATGKGLLASLNKKSANANNGGTGQHPNILFIFSDDHAVQAISAYGSRINKTPNIDRIAKEGTTFDRCFCANSLCAPSRATVLTGKLSHANGLMTNHDRFDSSQETFPKLLQKVNYQTVMLGKWHLKVQPTGFDYWKILIGQGNYYNPDFISPEGKERINGYATDIITDLALDWLENKRDKKRPFLLMCQHKAPHRTWAPPLRYLHRYDDVTIPEPSTFWDDYANRCDVVKKCRMRIADYLMYNYDLKIAGCKWKDKMGRSFGDPERNRMTPQQRAVWDAAYKPKNEKFLASHLEGKDLVNWKYQRFIKDYLRCIDAVDDSVKRLLDYLDKTGLAKNTIVVYSSDQGFYLGEHGWFDKRWMFKESFRMPFLIRWPGVTKPGTRTKALTQNIDFGPTFLDAAGVKVPSDMQGVSMKPLMAGKVPSNWRKSLYYHYYEGGGEHNVAPQEGVRTARYKLIHFYTVDEWELHDMLRDPHEMINVYDKPEYQPIVKKMKAELQRLRKYYKLPPNPPVKHRGKS